MNPTVLHLFYACSVALLLKLGFKKYATIQAVFAELRACPGRTILWLHPFRIAAIVTGGYFPPRGQIGSWFGRFSLYAKHGSTCLSSIYIWDNIPVFWLSDADTIKVVETSQKIFVKDVEAYTPVTMYGPNIVSTEGADWKRHRSVANAAFNEANNELVWRETSRIVDEWFADIDCGMDLNGHASIDIRKDSIQVAMLVILRASFGQHVSWKKEPNDQPSPVHKHPFREALSSVLDQMIVHVLVPAWMRRLSDIVYIPFISPALANTQAAFANFRLHVMEMIESARDSQGNERTSMDAALLRNLVAANVDDTARRLSDDELLSDTLHFLFAGHETSAHTLSFAVILLALHDDIQERAYEEVCRLWPDGAPSDHDAPQMSCRELMLQLQYISAIFHETLRFVPTVARFAKAVSADTTLQARRFSTNPNGRICDVEKYDVPLKAGSLVFIDVWGLHMNPIHWGDDVERFKPERFVDTDTYRWPRDAFNAFSGGARGCIGRRFAIAEGVCVLARLIRKYKIGIPDELRNKSFAEQKATMLKLKVGITSAPWNARVSLCLRS